MIKKFLYVLITISLIFSFGFKSYSFEYSEELMENIDDKTKEYLCELGIDEISFEEIFELTPTRVFKFIFSLIMPFLIFGWAICPFSFYIGWKNI